MIKILLIIFISAIFFCLWCCLSMASISDKEMIEHLENLKKYKK